MNIFKTIGDFLCKNKTPILTGVGITGIIFAGCMAVKQTPKALDHIKERKKELDIPEEEKLPPKEVIKTCWKDYIVPVGICALSAGTIITGVALKASEFNKMQGKLTALATTAETSAIAYREQLQAILGDKKFKEVETKMAQKRMDENPAPVAEPDDGKMWVTFKGTKQYIRSSVGEITLKLGKFYTNDLKRSSCMYASESDVLDAMGFDPNGFSDDVQYRGWNIYNTGGPELAEPEYHTDVNGRIICEMSFARPYPTADYQSF